MKILTFMKSIYNPQGKKTFSIALDFSSAILFGLTFLTIPLFSFRTNFTFITWIFTILFLCVSLLNLLFYHPIKIDKVSICLTLFVFSALFSSIFSKFEGFRFTPILLNVVSICVYIYCLSNKSVIKLFLLFSYAALVIFLFVFIIENPSDIFTVNSSRLEKIYGDQNDISMFFALCYMFSIYSLFYIKEIIIKVFAAIMAPLSLLCGSLCGSKIFILLVLVSTITIIFIFFGKKRWYISLIFVIAFIAIGILIINIPFFSFLKNRINNFISAFTGSGGDGSTVERFHLFVSSFKMFLQKPLFGYGVNGFANYNGMTGGWSHNNVGEFLTDFGLIGFILFHAPFVFSFIKIKKTGLLTKYRFSFVTVIFFITSMISVAFIREKIYSYFAPIAFASICDGFWSIDLIITKKKNRVVETKNERIKVCFVVSSLHIGGPSTLVTGLASNLDRDIFDPYVICMMNDVEKKYQDVLEANSIKLIVLNKRKGRFSFSFLRSLKKAILSVNPDIFSTHQSATFYVSLLKQFKKIPIIHTIHTIPKLDLNRFYRIVLKRRIKNHKLFLVGCSTSISKQASDLYSCDVTTISNGVMTERVNVDRNNDSFDYFTLGRLISMKRIDCIIQSFLKIKNKNNKLFIIGDGPERENLEKMAGSELNQSVFFTGFIDHPEKIFSKCSVHIMFSLWEGNPISILEAMCYGIPTIAPAVGGIPDVVDNTNGLLIGENSINDLENALLQIQNPKKWSFLNQGCLNSCLKHNIKVKANEYSELFLKVIKRE